MVKVAMDESDEIEMMFLKGHVSPPDSSSDEEDAIDACSEHCPLKAMLFEWISAVDNLESKEEKIKQYIHGGIDLLHAAGEILERLDDFNF